MFRLPKLGGLGWRLATRRTKTCTEPTAALRALALLRSAVGSDWPGWKDQHPLARQFATSLQGADPDGVQRLRNALVSTKTSSPREVRAVLLRLAGKSWSEYEGASLEFRLVASCLKEGFSAHLLDESVGGDLVATLEDRQVKVECKALQPRTQQDAFYDLAQAAMDLCAESLDRLGRTEIHCRGYLHEVIAHSDDMVATLARLSHSPEQLEKHWPGVSLRFTPGQDPAPAPFIEGPRLNNFGTQGDHLELVKLRQCIRSHEPQLRGDGPGVFAVGVRDLLDTSVSPQDIEAHLLAGIHDLPRVSGVLCMQDDVVLASSSSPVWNESETLWLVDGCSPVGLRRAAIFIRNPAAKVALRKGEILGLFRAFIRD